LEVSLDELENMDIVDEEGREIPIYSEDGYQIQRRLGRFKKRQEPHGVLLDLSRIQELFAPDLDDEEFMDGVPGRVSPRVSVYPQAGLRTAGHYQADGLMTKFYPMIERINRGIVVARREEDGDEEVDPSPHAPITGISSQGYNAVMHSTRGCSNQHHEAQLGMITNTLAGGWATSDSNKRTANGLKLRCERKLPHQTYAEKIENRGIQRDLRLENVYFFDVQALPSRMQNGRYGKE
jgi:hypothetical protein